MLCVFGKNQFNYAIAVSWKIHGGRNFSIGIRRTVIACSDCLLSHRQTYDLSEQKAPLHINALNFRRIRQHGVELHH